MGDDRGSKLSDDIGGGGQMKGSMHRSSSGIQEIIIGRELYIHIYTHIYIYEYK
jgi:hypothetical protein